MILSEKDAKFKFCPFLTTKDDKLRFCQAAGCMQWRYKHPDHNKEDDAGYCGLGGKPIGAM